MKNLPLALAAALLAVSLSAAAQMPRSKATEGASLMIVEPKDGATVKGPVHVVMRLTGMAVAPAGSDLPASGHHHLLVDVATLPPVDKPIPSDDHHRHFGKGQTETTVTLPPGKHTLQLLLGDRNHVPHDPPVVSPKITITVAP